MERADISIMRTAICDDDRQQAGTTKELLCAYNSKHPGRSEIRFEPIIFDSAEQLLKSVRMGRRFDLLLLEILLPGMDGLELAHKIREMDDDAAIIFITRSLSSIHPYDAYRVRAVSYFRKPIAENKDEDRFFGTLDRIVRPHINTTYR